jgi:hypothetical protein
MRNVSEDVMIKLNGQENVVLLFKDKDAPGGAYAWGFPSRLEFGCFVAALQAFYTAVRA